MKRGFFVTFEGGEGAGKSTLATRLQSALKADGYEALFTREPGGTPFGEELRGLLLHHKGHVAERSELFLFLASRVQHIEEVIKPALSSDSVVLCDRFSDSTVAYQGVARNLGFDFVIDCCKLATDDFQPDLTFYIDLDPEIGHQRVAGRRKKSGELIDRLEREALSFHKKVREGFYLLAERYPERIVTLDGTLDPDSLFNQAYEILRQRSSKAY